MAEQKTILVTGGAGMLGSHLCESLLARGNKVICLDNFLTGSRENISHLENHPDFSLVVHDVVEPFDIKADEIYNLACPTGPLRVKKDPVGTLRVCVWGAYNVLELARKTGARVLQTSTSEIYGDPTISPQAESYTGNVDTMGTRACYDEGKRAAETLFMDYHRQHGVRIRICRLFNAYGPRMRMDDDRVIRTFIVQALNGEPITLHGDGSQTRSFCYVDDMVQAIIRLMEEAPASATGPVNLGSPHPMTILEFAEAVQKACGTNVPVIHTPRPDDDPTHRRADISLARQMLGWEPTTSLEDGLAKTAAYYRSLLQTQTRAAA